ncbi:MAG TPA: HAD-IIIA family hydrolase [Polyangia bacterium]|jgi:D-glycero-D-manno-heptose 1,7-bisphosphate phosphatase|nr:HAD-IIIA family hydrolase [Polyangia bacterium]
MAADAGLIVLDRDGVLNRLLPNPAEPRPDSPMRPGEVEVFPWVPAALGALTRAGYGLCIASNQPAAAKGKTTRAELEAAHAVVLAAATAEGGVVLSSHLCFHRAEDGCACRKPATGLLEEAFALHRRYARARSWMVGDRAPDVLCGAAFGLQTAYLGEATSAEHAELVARGVRPAFVGRDLRDFVAFLLAPYDPSGRLPESA